MVHAEWRGVAYYLDSNELGITLLLLRCVSYRRIRWIYKFHTSNTRSSNRSITFQNKFEWHTKSVIIQDIINPCNI